VEIAWTVVGIVVPLLLGVMFALVGLNPPEFKAARICLVLSVVSLGGMDTYWHFMTDRSLAFRLAIGFLIWGSIGVGLPEGLRWISKRERSMEGTIEPPAMPSAPPVPGFGLSRDPHAPRAASTEGAPPTGPHSAPKSRPFLFKETASLIDDDTAVRVIFNNTSDYPALEASTQIQWRIVDKDYDVNDFDENSFAEPQSTALYRRTHVSR